MQDTPAGIAERFSRGDFSGPTEVHGVQMPGLALKKAKAGEISVHYQDLGKRLAKFGLELHPDKTRLIDFRPPAEHVGVETTLPTAFH